MIEALAWAALAWGSAVAAISIVAIARPRPRASAPPPPGPVVLVRPCAGAEPHLERALASSARARASFPLEVRIAIASADDGAAGAARAAAAELVAQGADAAVVVTAASGPNRKAGQLAAVLDRESRAAIAIVADADVDLAGADLDALIAPLGAGALAACWAPHAPRLAPRTAGDRLAHAVLAGSLHAFPLLARLDPGGLVGKLVAVRLDRLREAGGFAALEDRLGEDVELGRRLRARGGAVGPAPFVAATIASGRSRADVIERLARWLLVVRAQRPALLASYPLVFFATAPIVALGAAGAAAAPAPALAGALLALCARLAVARAAARAAARPHGVGAALADLALADGAIALAWLRALVTRSVRWRGRALTIGRGGRLGADPRRTRA